MAVIAGQDLGQPDIDLRVGLDDEGAVVITARVVGEPNASTLRLDPASARDLAMRLHRLADFAEEYEPTVARK